MNKIKQILTNENTKLKIISFLTALFLWSYVMGIVNPDRTVEYRGINVKETGLDYIEREGFSIVQPSDPKVNVTVSGKRSDLENISSENIIVKADLQGIKEGDTRIPLTYSIEPHTGDVEIVDVNPSSIVISVESIVTETLKIEVEALGDLPEGFTLGNINVLNNYVRVEAPKSQIEKIDRVLAYIDVTDKTNTFTTNSEIVFLDKNDIRLDGIKSDTQKIDIEVPVFKIKSVPVEPVFIGEPDENERIENIKVEPQNVVIRGEKENIDKITSIKTLPINYKTLSGQESYELKLDLPNGITLHDPTTNVKLNYDFALDIKKNLTLPASSFQIKNADENLNYKINTKIDHIALTLFGESKLLEDKNETNVFAYINVENLKPGDYVYDLMFENVDNLTVVESNPSEISFTITNKNMENLDEE